MKALSLTQPWASAIMRGHKRIETRSWPTKYRGRIAIHAAKAMSSSDMQFARSERMAGRLPFGDLPRMAVLGTALLVDCVPTASVAGSISDLERSYGNYAPGRYAFILDGIEPLVAPIPCRGALSLWEWDPPGEILVTVSLPPVPETVPIGDLFEGGAK
jgi:hypothetical protein